MSGSWRRGRAAPIVGDLRLARSEALLALVRAALLLASSATFVVSHPPQTSLAGQALIHLVLGLLSLAAVLPLARLRTLEAVERAAVLSLLADVAVYAVYTAAFADVAGAGSLLGVFLLVEGPLRWGWRGGVASGLPVALVASVWPPQDATGSTLSVGRTWLLCALFGGLTVLVQHGVARSGARMRQLEQQFATAFDRASIGMALLDETMTVVQTNRALSSLLGVPADSLLGTHLPDFVDSEDVAAVTTMLAELTESTPSHRMEVRFRRPDGGLRWGLVGTSLLAGGTGIDARTVVQVENLTERKRSEAMLSHAAGHDSLTDLPNRTLLLSRLEGAVHAAEQIAVLFLDLDRFKVVNDGLGHAVGDLLLVQVASRLREAVRPDDMVARLGGDEFVVLCRAADREVAETVAGRVLQALGRPFPTTEGGELVVGGSIGIAFAGPDDQATSVLRDADTAMYAAKAAGGGQIRHFTPQMREAVVRTHEMEVELRQAVRSDELHLVYQPVVDVDLGRVLGVEALVRWYHPRRGAMPTQEFVNVAEESDLIIELGDWVLRTALAEAARWPDRRDGMAPTVSVNVSVRQLRDLSFPARLVEMLDAAGLSATRLCLEVTETALVGDVSQVVEALEVLRELGVKLSIDDFGTGHASLTYLARFPVDQVKVDRSFVAGLGIDAGSAAIVEGVVAMAHTFDLTVVAEGVELVDQLAALRRAGADAVQGYLLAAPMSATALAELLGGPDAPTVPWRGLEVIPDRQSYDEERRLRLLVDGAREVTGRLDLDSVLEHAFVALGRAVDFTGGSIQLVEDGAVRLAAALPPPTPEALAARLPLGQGVSGTIAVTGQPRYLPDIAIASTVTANRRKKNSSTGVRSWYGVPLIAEGRPIGVLQIDSTEVDAFGEQDRLAVLSFAPVVALAVQCARRSAADLEALQKLQD